MKQGNIHVLQGNRGDSRHQDRDHQFPRLQFAHLPFAHQTDGNDDEDVEDKGANERHKHDRPPFGKRFNTIIVSQQGREYTKRGTEYLFRAS